MLELRSPISAHVCTGAHGQKYHSERLSARSPSAAHPQNGVNSIRAAGTVRCLCYARKKEDRYRTYQEGSRAELVWSELLDWQSVPGAGNWVVVLGELYQ